MESEKVAVAELGFQAPRGPIRNVKFLVQGHRGLASRLGGKASGLCSEGQAVLYSRVQACKRRLGAGSGIPGA